MQPAFELLVDGQSVDAVVNERLMNLNLTDEAEEYADKLSLVFDDRDGELALPRKGTELGLRLGYQGEPLIDKGSYVVDTIELSGLPEQMTIQANALDFNGKLKERQNRHFDQIRLGELVATLARAHGMQPVVSAALADVLIEHIEQHNEGDLALLRRLGQLYGAGAKASDQKLILMLRDEAKNSSGADLPAVELRPEQVSGWSVAIPERPAYKAVRARWRDIEANAVKEVLVGAGEPVFVIPNEFQSEASARRAAEARWRKVCKPQAKLSMSLPGQAELAALYPLRLVGFREGVSGDWLVDQVTHKLSNSGFTTSIKAELMN